MFQIIEKKSRRENSAGKERREGVGRDLSLQWNLNSRGTLRTIKIDPESEVSLLKVTYTKVIEWISGQGTYK